MSTASVNFRRASLFGRRLFGTLAARAVGSLPDGRYAEIPSDAFRSAAAAAVAELPAGLLLEHALLRLPADRAPWFDTGIELDIGEDVSWMANGRVHLSKLLDIYIEPHFQLWARIGDGEVFRGLRETHTFTAASAGRLQLASYFPGEWSTPDGGFDTPAKSWSGIGGGTDVLLLRWAGAGEPGLEALAASGYAPAISELDRGRSIRPVPEDWSYLWFLGRGEIYEQHREDGRTCIDCHTHADVGILRKEIDVGLAADTTLRWQWNVAELPSRLGEDLLPTHDYLSIAVEYDNGIDVTYYWSAELPVDEGYWCPLPTWKDREFHIVVRSGSSGLGGWHTEERNLYDDYQRYIGGPPARVVRVWLIANSLFQRRHGRCRYAEISVGGAGDRTAVL
jgi:hypothetical protein